LCATVAGRVVLYSILLVSLTAAVLLAFLQTQTFEKALAQAILSALRDTIEAPVTIRSLRLDLLGGRVLIFGFQIGPKRESLPAPLSADLIFVKVGFGEMFSGRLDLERVFVPPCTRLKMAPRR